jgi:hypothetical protein
MEGMCGAKKAMLKELSKEMSNDANEPLKDVLSKKKGLKKVTVASDSPEGLKKGLSMAEKLMKLKSEQNGEEMEDEESEMAESPKMEAEEEMSEMSEEEAMALYEMLKKRFEA